MKPELARSAIPCENTVKPASPFCHTDEQGEAWVHDRLKVTILVTQIEVSFFG
jgi:hypothetical protein